MFSKGFDVLTTNTSPLDPVCEVTSEVLNSICDAVTMHYA